MEPAATKPTYDELVAENLSLKTELAQLRRLIFGQKRERYVPVLQDRQMDFGLEGETRAQVPAQTEAISYTRQKTRKKHTPHGRSPLPASLPRTEITIEPDEDTSGLKKIGEEITEELEYEPGKLYVNRYIRPKYARPDGEGILIGALPTRPIEKGIAGPGLLAQVAISKFVDHIPLYRQVQQFKRHGIELAESTLGGWIKGTYELLLPLYELERERILSSHYLQVDETRINVLDPLKNGTTHSGYYWVYHDPLTGQLFFDYRSGRSRAGPSELLENFTGHLQTDGYTVYDQLVARDEITGVGCFAHARRKFVEAEPADRERGGWMLSSLQKLYALERQAREEGLSYDQRYQLRQQAALPVLAEMKAWLDQECKQVLPKSVMGKAIGYMLGQWSRLDRYTTDGCLEIDNNQVENAIRPVALGRKNYLFAGSHRGARRAAVIDTIVANAKLKDVEPFAYLRDLLKRLPEYPYKKPAELLPQNWKPIPEA